MKIAILAQFPLHFIPDFKTLGEPEGHYATWLPQLAEEFSQTSNWRAIPKSPLDDTESGYRQQAHSGFVEPEIHWIVLSPDVHQVRRTTYLGQTFHVLPTSTRMRASTLFRDDCKSVGRLLGKIGPDIVHGWGTEDVYGLAAVTAGYKNIVSMAGILSHYALKTRMRPREYFQALLEIWILRKAGLVTVETQWGQSIVRSRTPQTVSVIEYGVRQLFYEVEWRPDSTQPTCLFVGGLCPRKGIHDLVAAFGQPQLENATLRVVGYGSGSWCRRLKERATRNIQWLGQLSPEQVAIELQRAWCLALPTRCDTSPNVVKEARVVGMPVITSACGGQQDYIKNSANGFIVKCGDVSQLADRLSFLLSDFHRCRSLGAYNHDAMRRHFHPRRTARLFLSLYNQEIKRQEHSV